MSPEKYLIALKRYGNSADVTGKEVNMEIKFVTFNIRLDVTSDGINCFGNRLPYITEKIYAEKPDFINFQEVTAPMRIRLQDALPDYAIVGSGRESDRNGESICIAYRKNRFMLDELQTVWLSETPDIPGSTYGGDQACIRIMDYAMFTEFSTSSSLMIFNVHADHVGQQSRKRSFVLIRKYIEDMYKTHPMPVILSGDLNCPPTNPELEPIQTCPLLRDITGGFEKTYHSYGEDVEYKFRKIDYIFVSDDIKADRTCLWDECHDGIYLSDHYPVCSMLSFPASAGK